MIFYDKTISLVFGSKSVCHFARHVSCLRGLVMMTAGNGNYNNGGCANHDDNDDGG